MKTLKPILIVLAVALVAVSGVVDSGHASEQSMSRRKARPNARTFTVSGTYTGLLSGDVIVSGRSIFIAKNAVVYDVEDGILDPEMPVASSNVSLTGTIKNGNLVASLIIVSRNEGSDYSTVTMPDVIAPVGRPR